MGKYYEPGNLYLGTNSSAKMVIASDGNVGIGVTAPVQKLDINGALNIRGNGSLDIFCDGEEALWFNGTYFSWGYGGEYNFFGDKVTIGTLAVPGYTLVVNGTAAKTGGGSWSTLSDIRLKDLRGDYLKGLNEILHLNPVRFTYKSGNPRELDSNTEQIGFVAQDVQKIFPEAVNLCEDGYLDFNIHSITVALVNAVKELKAENDRLKSRLDKIESMMGGTAEK